jgi:hypothetical protein
MDGIAEVLDAKLHQWKPEISVEVRALVAEIIDLADANALDLIRSRTAEQEVLNLLDEPLGMD